MNEEELRQYFDYHNSNMKSLKIGYDELRNQIKSFYKLTDRNGTLIYSLQDSDPKKIELRKKEKSFSRILSGIQSSWAEESLKRLLYERNFLNDTQRNYILNLPLGQKWIEVFKIAFCIEYDLVPVNNDICAGVKIKQEKNNLGNELVQQYLSTRKIITKHLTPSFEIRNKVQHGEWEFAFKPPNSEEFSQSWTDKVNKENLITTTSRYTLVNAVYNMIVDLGRFKSNSFALDSITTPFEYFHKKYMMKINFEVEKIKTCDLEKFIDEIVQKEIRGLEYRN